MGGGGSTAVLSRVCVSTRESEDLRVFGGSNDGGGGSGGRGDPFAMDRVPLLPLPFDVEALLAAVSDTVG